MIEKESGFIYLEKNEITYYIANLWRGEIVIQSRKSKKYSQKIINKFFNILWSLINIHWDGKSSFRLTRKGKKPDRILSQACQQSGIGYEDLPNEFTFYSSRKSAIEWRKQTHPCIFHKNNIDDYKFADNIGNPII